jgi:aminoglycoside phosphotransferase family enzyme
MGRSDTDLIDPELGSRFVRVEIDHRADKAHDKVIVQGNDQAMARISQKLPRRRLHDGIVKDVHGDIIQVVSIVETKNLDFDHGYL